MLEYGNDKTEPRQARRRGPANKAASGESRSELVEETIYDAAEVLLDGAGGCFKLDDDAGARHLRDLARYLKSCAPVPNDAPSNVWTTQPIPDDATFWGDVLVKDKNDIVCARGGRRHAGRWELNDGAIGASEVIAWRRVPPPLGAVDAGDAIPD